jgi:hypothetical protein
MMPDEIWKTNLAWENAITLWERLVNIVYHHGTVGITLPSTSTCGTEAGND